jgi:aromatic-L-amino-acid/L-tryptophan decarboxylase
MAADTRVAAPRTEETLDPSNWSCFRALAHRMVDDTLDHLSALGSQPAWQPMPDSVRNSFHEPVPQESSDAASVYAQFLERVRPYPNGNLHPRFWGWVQGTGTPLAMMADMLASALNPHLAGFNQAPALVEHQVLAWLTELMGFPPETSGLLVSGGTMANLTGLAVARQAKAGFDLREQGLQDYCGPRLVFYASSETHGWCQKAAELLGFGNASFRRVPVSSAHTIDVDALCSFIDHDRRNGMLPFSVVGNAGTINIGATDNLCALAEICREQNLWFHVDGAFGALARFSRQLRPIVEGIDLADSVAFDLHKWMYLPFEIGCILVRDPAAQAATFALRQSYFGDSERGLVAGGLPFADRGIELTRSFRALKVWMSLKCHGVNQYARLIEQNVAQARYLAGLIQSQPKLELLAPVPLNVVCFRYHPSQADESKLNVLNQELLLRLQESGTAVLSSTMLDGRFALRAAITNHRSRQADFDTLVAAVLQLGRSISAYGPPLCPS